MVAIDMYGKSLIYINNVYKLILINTYIYILRKDDRLLH